MGITEKLTLEKVIANEKRGSHAVGAPITACQKAKAVLSAAEHFPSGIHYKLSFLAANSKTAAHWIGNVAGITTVDTPGPPRAIGWGADFNSILARNRLPIGP